MDIENIANVAKELAEMQNEHLGELEKYFEVIVYRNMTNGREIEHLLDSVLGMIQTDETLDFYTKICIYYHAIDSEAAMDYAQYYLEFYDDDSVVKKVMEEERERKKRKYEKK